MKKIEIEILNYNWTKNIRCLVCKKLIKNIPHSRKHYVEKRQKTCRSKECLLRYAEVKRNLLSSKKKKNKQQREKYKNDLDYRKRKKEYQNRPEVKNKKRIRGRNYMRIKLKIPKERWRK